MNLNFWQKSFYSLFLTSFVVFVSLFPVFALAQSQTGDAPGGTPQTGDAPDPKTRLENPIKAENLNDFIKTVLEGAIRIGIPIIALAIIYSGFLYVTAMGNEEKLKTAHNAILYTLIGAALLIGSWAIAQLISETVLKL